MHHGSMIADARGRRRRWAGPAVAVVAALAAATAAATWVDDSSLPISAATASTDAPVSRIEQSFFDLRFSVHQAKRSFGPEGKIQMANVLFAQKPTYDGFSGEGLHGALPDEAIETRPAEVEAKTADTVVPAIPLPRSRPTDVSLASRDQKAAVNDKASASDGDSTHPDDPTLLQKLSGMFRYRLTLASLTPNDGIFASAPDLAALGYDKETAVYDITAHMVYLPNGSKLEAHSGLGDSRDDPRRVSERAVGSTPPAIYELKPREALFHGVQALRMLPVEGSALGRTGLLVHSYMLGPNGDSNGCVSVRDYDRFLAAYQKGDFKRLAVVSNLAGSTARQSSFQSANGGT
jgi:hypothetical protein